MSQPQPRGFQSMRVPEKKESLSSGGFVSRRVPVQQTLPAATGQGSFVSLRTVAYQGLPPVQYSVFFGRYRRKHPSVSAKKIAKKYERAVGLYRGT